jgi:hypothetical protein
MATGCLKAESPAAGRDPASAGSGIAWRPPGMLDLARQPDEYARVDGLLDAAGGAMALAVFEGLEAV